MWKDKAKGEQGQEQPGPCEARRVLSLPIPTASSCAWLQWEAPPASAVLREQQTGTRCVPKVPELAKEPRAARVWPQGAGQEEGAGGPCRVAVGKPPALRASEKREKVPQMVLSMRLAACSNDT